MASNKSRNTNRKARHARVRKKIVGTAVKPRLNVYRSNQNIYAQIIDDVTGNTLIAASSLETSVKDKVSNAGNKEAAKLVGELVAKKALEKGIEDVVFDRGGYLYHGRVKELAEGAREAGLKF
ncbi:50S ribosomal protein L18 [Fusibacter bizertensis]|jgi:ribosomal protein L18, bacterial type|uniref:Large ribosomal subunit protein uL18 n=1 Tax=Fusibacter bizertensis TaxID=1488331 RepID=A0ABT6NHI1_9FIRM|nr:50S ribosomal protein L18 [Fusibacter bizertensis]MDH8679798.1 50S ribosomal protein L18 [Fusibacter bizertensis]